MGTVHCLEELDNAKTEVYQPSAGPAGIKEINFDLNSLHNSRFRELVKYYDDTSGAPLEYLITSLLSAISGAIGKSVYFDISRNIKIFLNIWAVLIGKSTIMKKTTAINEAISELNKINIKYRDEYQAAMQIYLEQQAKKKKKKDEPQEPPELSEPAPVRKYIRLPDDSTIESLSVILEKSQRGVYVTQEFGGFLKRMNRSYSGDSKQFLTDVFDVPESYEVSRLTRDSVFLSRPYISIIGASTIEWFKSNSEYNDIKSGFFARFLYSIKNQNLKPYTPLLELAGRRIIKPPAFHIPEFFLRLCEMNDFVLMEIEPEARDLHINWDVEGYKELLHSDDPNELSFKARLLIYSIKIAGVIAITNRRTTVSVEDMEDAIQLAEYYKKNIEILLSLTSNNLEMTDKEQKFIKIIQGRGGVIRHSELLHSSHEELKNFNLIIDTLIQKEKIEREITKKSGQREIKIYKLMNQ